MGKVIGFQHKTKDAFLSKKKAQKKYRVTHQEFAKRFLEVLLYVLVRLSRFFGPMMMLVSDKIPIFDFRIVIFVRDHLLASISN